ncbi:MAG: hypothetical protein ABSE77_08310, partial [Acidimicrobiales bacterium]
DGARGVANLPGRGWAAGAHEPRPGAAAADGAPEGAPPVTAFGGREKNGSRGPAQTAVVDAGMPAPRELAVVVAAAASSATR